MSVYRVVLTGGPCAGKTTISNAVKSHFGTQITDVPEVATNTLPIFPKPGLAAEAWNLAFQAAVMQTQLGLETTYYHQALENESRLLFFDRGLGDGPGYISGDGWKYFEDNFGLKKEDVLARYDMVIHLESVAVANPDLYERLKASNASRYENAEQAAERDAAIKNSWREHPNWVCIPSSLSLEEKTERVIELLSSYLDTEIEKKYRIFSLPSDLPAGIPVCQAYFPLRAEMRVRSMGDKFYLTIKDSTGLLSRKECERQIDGWAFAALWPEASDGSIYKTRYFIPHGQFTLEVDVYEQQLQGLITMECEFRTLLEIEQFTLPNWAKDAEDITDNRNYKNRILARDGLPQEYYKSTA